MKGPLLLLGTSSAQVSKLANLPINLLPSGGTWRSLEKLPGRQGQVCCSHVQPQVPSLGFLCQGSESFLCPLSYFLVVSTNPGQSTHWGLIFHGDKMTGTAHSLAWSMWQQTGTRRIHPSFPTRSQLHTWAHGCMRSKGSRVHPAEALRSLLLQTGKNPRLLQPPGLFPAIA